MKKNIDNYLKSYFLILFFFAIFFLYIKHNVGNDSTISEWLINYTGGFTKRGLIGQISIYFSNLFSLNLRDSILIFQIFIVGSYFICLYFFLKNILFDRILLLAVFTPIFILFPIAEIEVLARKEVFIFIFFLGYVSISKDKSNFQNLYKLIIFPLCILIWEPIIFFVLFWVFLDIVKSQNEKFNLNFFYKFLFYVPAVLIALHIVLNPITNQQHDKMVEFLLLNFNETCYMSCQLLKSKSSIVQQFQGNFGKYSIEIFVRYFLIILFGFAPLFYLLLNSRLKNNNLIIFNNFRNLFFPFLIILSPVLFLFAMGYDWGRWVNISYVFSIVSYLYLYKNKLLIVSEDNLKKNKIILLNKKIFVIIFIIFCFGWNPKTVMTGDVASKPGYAIPYKALKILTQK